MTLSITAEHDIIYLQGQYLFISTTHHYPPKTNFLYPQKGREIELGKKIRSSYKRIEQEELQTL